MKIGLLVVASLLLVAGPAAAQDKCLSGSSTLQDQRDLATLRSGIDAACPCASFGGSPGADRSAYRRCARTVRDQALAGGTLRKQCRMPATRGYFDATCGTIGKVACGRVTPASRTKPVSCSVKPADRCHDAAKFSENVCAAQTHCSDVVDWTAGTCVDVRARTPFEAGVRTITYTKQSVVDPTQARPLDTVIWYPTNPGAGPISPQQAAVIDAPLAAGGPYPLVLFSHGLCGYPLQSTFLTALLAAQCFVVVAPPHPGNTLSEFPTCGTPTAQVNSFLERPSDIVFVLNQVLAASADPSSPLFGAIDPDRIAMSGHSFGGLTTYLVQSIEPRVKVAIPMAPATIAAQPLTVPSLTMFGAIDTVVSLPPIRALYASSAPPKFEVEIQHAGHYAFSGACFPSSDCNPPTTLTQDEAHGQVLRWVLPFLEVYLNDNQDFTPFFLAPRPGVTVASQLQ